MMRLAWIVPLCALALLGSQPLSAQPYTPPPAGYYDAPIGFATWQIDIFNDGSFQARWLGDEWEDGDCDQIGVTRWRLNFDDDNPNDPPGDEIRWEPDADGVYGLFLYSNGRRVTQFRRTGP